MSSKLKRALSVLLMVCMLLSFAAPAVLAEENAEEPRVVTYDFDLGASTTLTGFAGKALSNNHESGKKISEVLKDYYADGTLNWSVEALADGLKESEAMFRAAPQGWRISAEDGEWLALRIKNPGAGTYDLTLKRGMTSKSNGAVYILDGSTTDIANAIAAEKPVAEIEYSYEGDASVSLGKYTFGEGEEYIVVFKGSGRFYLAALTMTAVEEEKPVVTEVTYDFDLGASTTLTGFAGKALSNNHASGKKISEVLKDYYADGTLNWSVEALADGLKESEAMFRAAPQGWRITAEDGEWLALRIKNPGAGTYDLCLKRGATYKSNGAVYILDGSTTDIANAIATEKPVAEIEYSYEGDASVSRGKYTFCEGEEYIVVFKGSGRFYLAALTMTSVNEEKPVVTEKIYDFALADKETGIYSVAEGEEYVDVKEKLEDIASRYAAGELNWNYQGICSELSPEGELPATTVRMYPQTGMRLYSNEGAWIAFKIKSPGEGIRTLTLNHAISANGAKATVYILPADTTDIDKAIDPSNRVGKVNFHNTDAAEGLQDGISTIVGSYRFDTAEEYILVIEATNHTPFNDHRAYLFFSNLVITEGYTDKPEEEGAKINPIMISDEVVNVGDAQSAGMSAEINGEDIYFSPIKGGKMYVYNLKTMQMIDEVDTGINYPNGAAIGKDGVVWLGGTTKNLFKYDPSTGIGTSVGSFATGPLSGTSGLYDMTMGDDGCLYFGTIKPAHIVKYDPATRQYTDFGCMDEKANRVSAVTYKDGFVYGCVEGENLHKLIKMSVETGEVLDTLDISEQAGAVDYMAKMAFLDDNTLIVGANRLEKMIAVDISGAQMTFKDIGIGTGMNNTISEAKDGKVYFVAYNLGLCEYDIASGKAKVVEGLEAANIGFRFVNNTWVSVDHPDLPGESLFTFSASGAVPVFYNLETKKVVKIESLTNGYGAGQIIRGFVSSTDGSNQLYIGAFNTKNATVFDVNTGTFTKHYMTAGQTDSQIIYQGKLYAGNYNPGRVVEADVDSGKVTVLINMGLEPFMQDRIHTLTAGDNKIFAGTTPEKYLYGGYLAWYDLETKRTYVAIEPDRAVYAEADDQNKWYDAKTNELCDFDADNDGVDEYQAFKGIVAEQTINCIVYHDGLIYGTSSTVGGTGSAARPDLSAVLFVYDVENMELLGTYDLCQAISGLVSPITFVSGIAADPEVTTNGRFWGMVSETLFTFTFDKETKTFHVQEELSFDKTTYTPGGSRNWFPRPFVFKNGYLYTSFYPNGGMRKINMDNPLDNQRIMGDNPLWYVIAEDGNLYYSCNDSALNVLPLDVTDEDWAKAEAVDALIAAIASPVTVDSDVAVKAARSAYNALSWAHRALVQKHTALEEAESDLTEAKIDTIGEVTLEDAALIGIIRAEYEELSAQQKEYVKNYDTLLEAENILADLQAAAEEAAVDTVIAKIEAIGTVTLGSEEAIKAARAAYDALAEDKKALVGNLDTLTDAEAKLAELKMASEKEAADKAAADAVNAKIEAIGTVTLESEEAIKAARTAYDALTVAQKALVRNLATLTDAEAKLAELKVASEKEAADKAAADAVNAKIEAIGTVTLESEEAIKAARAAYDALTVAQKAFVSNLDTLTNAEAKLAALKVAAEKIAADKAAADAVIAKINAIGKVNAESGQAIAAARKAYNALTDAQKVFVSNLDVLTAAEADYEDAIKDPSSPDTGDRVPVILLVCVALVSAMAIAAIPEMRKKA